MTCKCSTESRQNSFLTAFRATLQSEWGVDPPWVIGASRITVLRGHSDEDGTRGNPTPRRNSYPWYRMCTGKRRSGQASGNCFVS
eukprot:3100606-Rhodomonas_salina.2